MKTLTYVKTNGNHIIQKESLEHNSIIANGGYQNGTVMHGEEVHYERNLRSSKQSQEVPLDYNSADPNKLQAQGTRKRKPRRSELGGHLGGENYEVKTRLRTRKSQAGL